MALRMIHYGAAGGVTGSKHLLDTGSMRILLDCGIFQGSAEAEAKNRSFPFDPASLDAVVLSHAHADHAGMLPLLVKRGFTGPIYATAATREIAAHIMRDSANIEVHEAAARKRDRIGPPEDWVPIITTKDVEPVLQQFVEVSYARDHDGWHDLGKGVRLKCYDAGHILGSAVPILEMQTPSGPFRLAYSGDLGAPGMPLLYDPDVPSESIDTVLVETTYGDRTHESFGEAVSRLAAVIRTVAERGGKLLIPAFSLGRTQLLIYLLHKLSNANEIPRIPIIVDSPLATRITEVFTRHRDEFDRETASDFARDGHTPLDFPNLTYTQSIEESLAVHEMRGPLAIISSSGMMSGGRIIDHLRSAIGDARNAVLIVGYQAPGTPGRALVDGARTVELRGRQYAIRAEVFTFDAFSAHADQGQIMSWLEHIPGVRHVVLVHGEPAAADALRLLLAERHPAWRFDRPDEGDAVELR
ncbi:MAG: MBL fold metallo-hydrolase [bacterium]|nr:MBL fold metallo-hydrolase [bacterium]